MKRIARLLPVLAALAVLVPAAAHADDATLLNGPWEGWFSCPQGERGLKLELTGTPTGAVTGVLTYGPMGSEVVSKGRYEVAGTLTGGVVTLKGVRWIDQSSKDEMLDLTGKIEMKDGVIDGFGGDLSEAGCRGFVVARPQPNL